MPRTSAFDRGLPPSRSLRRGPLPQAPTSGPSRRLLRAAAAAGRHTGSYRSLSTRTICAVDGSRSYAPREVRTLAEGLEDQVGRLSVRPAVLGVTVPVEVGDVRVEPLGPAVRLVLRDIKHAIDAA